MKDGASTTPRQLQIMSWLLTPQACQQRLGWTDRGTGHVLDIHHYPEPVAPEAERGAIVLGELAAWGFGAGSSLEQNEWGYERCGTDALLLKYTDSIRASDIWLRRRADASVYTQTIAWTETNGLMTYDRKVDKMGALNVKKAMEGGRQ